MIGIAEVCAYIFPVTGVAANVKRGASADRVVSLMEQGSLRAYASTPALPHMSTQTDENRRLLHFRDVCRCA